MRSESTLLSLTPLYLSHYYGYNYIKLIGPRIKDCVNESTINLSSKQINIGL